MIKIDLHTHTSYCDGADTPEEMAREAWARGFSAIGFSGHSYVPFDLECCMNEEETKAYRAEVMRLKNEYRGKMEIFLGLEQDYYAPKPKEPYDYRIGSVHYLLVDGTYYPVDLDAETLEQLCSVHFKGDFDLLAEQYFSTVSKVVEKTNCEIIGHLDLISKFFDRMGYQPSEKYLKAAKEAVHVLAEYQKPFEINVGAMTRGYRKVPYPSEEILREIKKAGGSIVINGDCHQKQCLGKYLPEAAVFAKKCGFESRQILTENGWCEEMLDISYGKW